MQKKNILNLSLEDLEKEIVATGEPKFRAKQIFSSIHKSNVTSLADLKGVPLRLKEELARDYFLPELKTVKVTDSGNFNTKKFLFEINSGDKNYFIETVLISEKGRDTFCISTQVGCNVGCEFCATGKMGFKKNLDAGQILSQVYEVIKQTKISPTNIVYMGMGEPFLNYENMLKSLKILTHPDGMSLSSKRITVSTVGFTGKIKKFADDLSLEENRPVRNVKLALSLHSTNNGIRESIIPTSVKNNLRDIYKELVYFYQKTKNKITYEYIFFPGLNDSDNDVKRISKVVKMVPSNLNIIPFHPIEFELRKPLDIFNNKKDINKLLLNKKLNDFIARLKNEMVVVNLRTSSGVDINAACGQLAVIEGKSNF
ncbi:MAG: 23S rRNA (adenine(2503)-C(2))-methyltransferase RlmN [Ignavibacteria bacterium]